LGYKIIAYCTKCGFKLFEASNDMVSYNGPPLLSRVIHLHGGKCPYCGKPLQPQTPIIMTLEEFEKRYVDLGMRIEEAGDHLS